MFLNANKNNLNAPKNKIISDENKTVWQGANFLLAISSFLSLFLSCFVGKWGLTDYNQEIFWPALLAYFFAKLLCLRWLAAIWLVFVVLAFNLPINYPFYFIGLGLAIFLINKTSWPFWILAPLAVHIVGLLSFENNLMQIFYKFETLSKHSLIVESIMVYPLGFLGFWAARLLNWFRYLE